MKKIQANIVIEILGRPPEHIKEGLNTIITKMGSEKGLKVLEKKYHEPIPVKDSKDLHTAFAEVTLELETLDDYFAMLYAYMPAHAEVISPENLALNNIGLNDMSNKMLARLHEYDEIAKVIKNELDIMAERLYKYEPESFKQAPPGVATQEKPKED